jgi:hypothetical protein
MMARNCRWVRRQLSAFHDGELPVGDQIAVQAHLRDCPVCAGEAGDVEAVGSFLRAGALSTKVEPDVWCGLPSTVVSRLKAEDAESIKGWTERVFQDLHLVWAGLGATGATITCLAIIFTICHYAVKSPAGSNQNPVVVDTRMSLPIASFSNEAFPATAMLDETELALRAVVTREGQIANLEVLTDGGKHAVSKADQQRVVDLLDAISKARFKPARYAGSPMPVAVDMVWLYASLTVRAKPPEQIQTPPRPSRSSSSAISDGLGRPAVGFA